jgi:hypothetical protein
MGLAGRIFQMQVQLVLGASALSLPGPTANLTLGSGNL